MLNYQRVPISKMVIFHIKLLDYLKDAYWNDGQPARARETYKTWVISLYCAWRLRVDEVDKGLFSNETSLRS